MNEQRDKYLTEAMGACWHQYNEEKPLMTYSLIAYVCEKCKAFILGNNDFSNDEDFPKLWNWAKRQPVLSSLVAACEGTDGTGPSDAAARETFADQVCALIKPK
ncbi:MAG TPA: hypothetical protein VMT71_00470 [Syntrophorhabdales bacterium]|nr:hypothetical protein [Syntrophorhabdales bacterium]